jgi:hypothetical protein
MIYIHLYRNTSGTKKFTAEIPVPGQDHLTRTVHFGQRGASDYTIHKNPLRMEQYIRRHGGKPTRFTEPSKVHETMLKRTRSTKEDWSKAGIYTAGFWSRWLLWSQPSLREAIRYVEKQILPKGYRIVLKK